MDRRYQIMRCVLNWETLANLLVPPYRNALEGALIGLIPIPEAGLLGISPADRTVVRLFGERDEYGSTMLYLCSNHRVS